MKKLLLLFALTAAASLAGVSHHIVQLRPQGDKLMVMETFICTAGGPSAVKVFIPKAAGDSVQAGSPLEKTAQADVYQLKVPATQKDTPVQVGYELPFAGKFVGKSMQPDAPTRFLAPPGVKLSGPDIEEGQTPPGMKGVVYAAKSASYAIKVEGGAEPEAEAPAEPPAKGGDEGPGIDRIQPRVYDRMYLLLGMAFAILALGFILLYRRTAK
jgi:hypothetical protein